MKKLFSLLMVFVLFFSIASCDEKTFQKKYSVVLEGNHGKETIKLTTYDNIFEVGEGKTVLVDKNGKEYEASYATSLIYPSCDCDNCKDEATRETKLYVPLAWTNLQSFDDFLNGITTTNGFKETSNEVCYVYDKDTGHFVVD